MNLKWPIKLLFIAMMVLAAAGSGSRFKVHLKVLDPGGKPVPEFEVEVLAANVNLSWETGKDGDIDVWLRPDNILIPGGVRRYQIIVRAAGFAPAIIEMDRPEGNIEQKVTLTKGQCIELVLTAKNGRAIPDTLEPIVVFPDFQKEIWRIFQHQGRYEFGLNFTSLYKLRPGYYNFHIAEDSPEIYVFLDHPGFMRAFRAGPFRKEELADGKLEIELPEPAKLEIVVKPPKEPLEKLPYDVWRVNIDRQSPDDETTGYPLVSIGSDEMDVRIDRQFLAPGGYWVTFETGPADRTVEFVQGRVNPAFYRDMKRYSFVPGQVEKVLFRYTAYDEDRYKGDHNVTINVCWHNGKPAAGLPYTLYHEDRSFGSITIREGKIPDNGRIELTGLTGEEDMSYFTLEIEKGELGRYLFQLLGEKKTRELEYKIAPQKGDMAPDITFVDIFTGQRVKLSDFKGKVIFLEFWATWCGPCQGPMAHLCEMAFKRKADWNGEAVLLCVSIDDKKDDVIRYVSSRGWLRVRHLWCEEGEPGFKSVGAKTYGITGVPTVLLIDQSGRMVWRGHPGSFDTEANIDELLKDE